ncbi:unnamed protein product [Psylliodes chrysocephalus]|uniref:MADF domain-containing protein n=1 Tax=Psylliodes chrysocephalus TaxID=3402493 RepID=A0A9P0DBU0_9CUCU|nr:unnamed protein product [Psylliodes chrysocephala]
MHKSTAGQLYEKYAEKLKLKTKVKIKIADFKSLEDKFLLFSSIFSIDVESVGTESYANRVFLKNNEDPCSSITPTGPSVSGSPLPKRTIPACIQLNPRNTTTETRNQAYQDITSGLRNVKPCIEFTEAMVTAKIYTLRTQYTSERKKIRKSEISGASPDEIFVPKLWCFEILRFLDDAEVIVEGQSNLDLANTETEEEGNVLFKGSIDDASRLFTTNFEVN